MINSTITPVRGYYLFKLSSLQRRCSIISLVKTLDRTCRFIATNSAYCNMSTQSLKQPRVCLSKESQTFLNGKVVHAVDSSKPVNAFLGIPFAEPPVGKLRFQPPKPLQLWNGERNATDFGPVCPQNLSFEQKSHYPYTTPQTSSEDCLYLNVWTPDCDPQAKLPVFFWIYGGAFLGGFGDIYTGTALCTFHDIIVVSFNYRVGALGFFTTGDQHAPGNCGLLDQVEALRWVNKHIHNFGGDPGNITIGGESAGGISSSYHMLSDLSRGLFQRAICQSGISTFPWAVKTYQEAERISRKRLHSIGCTGTTSQEKVEFLRTVPADELNARLISSAEPVVDGHFIKDFPLNQYESGQFQDVDLLLGFNSDEGSLVLDLGPKGFGTEVMPTRDTYMSFLSLMVKLRFPHSRDEVTRLVSEEYITPNMLDDPNKLLQAMMDFYGDALFVYSINDVAKKQCAKSSVYMYEFDHRADMSPRPDYMQAGHGDELVFMFGEPFLDKLVVPPSAFSENDRKVSQLMMNYWANFIKTGNPNDNHQQKWPKYRPEKKEYLILNSSPGVASQYKPQRMKFWDHMKKYMMDKKPFRPLSKY